MYSPDAVNQWTLDSVIYSPAGANGNFGISVDQDGQWLVAGANAYAYYTGVAFVYQRVAKGSWKLHSRLNSPLGVSQGFGYNVAIDGDVIVVGTSVNDAFIYELVDGEWVRTKDLSNDMPFTGFGKKVDVSGDYVVVGAPQVKDTEGEAYLYYRTSSQNWELAHTFKSVGGWNTQFGFSVAIYNSTVAIGAVGYKQNVFGAKGVDTPDNTGWVYTYNIVQIPEPVVSPASEDRRLSITIELVDSIQSPAGKGSYFGASVGLHGDSLIVGANGYRKLILLILIFVISL